MLDFAVVVRASMRYQLAASEASDICCLSLATTILVPLALLSILYIDCDVYMTIAFLQKSD